MNLTSTESTQKTRLFSNTMKLEEAVEDESLREKIRDQLQEKAGMSWEDLPENKQKKLAAGSKVLDKRVRDRLGVR